MRRAELEVRRNELISEIDARKNVLTLEEARRRKQKLEEDIKNRLQQREAELAVLREQINKAQLDVDRDRRRIEQSRVLAPMTGLVSVLQNRSGAAAASGQSTPDIREGDQIPAGMSVTQLLDLSEMELVTKVEEVERANLKEGQTVVIRLDALPGKTVEGKIERLGNTASTNIFAGEATRNSSASSRSTCGSCSPTSALTKSASRASWRRRARMRLPATVRPAARPVVAAAGKAANNKLRPAANNRRKADRAANNKLRPAAGSAARAAAATARRKADKAANSKLKPAAGSAARAAAATARRKADRAANSKLRPAAGSAARAATVTARRKADRAANSKPKPAGGSAVKAAAAEAPIRQRCSAGFRKTPAKRRKRCSKAADRKN